MLNFAVDGTVRRDSDMTLIEFLNYLDQSNQDGVGSGEVRWRCSNEGTVACGRNRQILLGQERIRCRPRWNTLKIGFGFPGHFSSQITRFGCLEVWNVSVNCNYGWIADRRRLWSLGSFVVPTWRCTICSILCHMNVTYTHGRTHALSHTNTNARTHLQHP